jgi:Ca2+-binding EF-hand superfamily protein
MTKEVTMVTRKRTTALLRCPSARAGISRTHFTSLHFTHFTSLHFTHSLPSENPKYTFEQFRDWYIAGNFDLKRAFTKYDSEELGEIPRDGFYGFLSAVAGLNEKEVEDALEDMDADHGGTVDFGEFKDWYLEKLPGLRARRTVMMQNLNGEKDLIFCFETFDTNNNGALERDEFACLMGAIAGRDLSFKEIDMLMEVSGLQV